MILEPKIILTSSNERLIAGLGEYSDEEGRKVCLVFKSPYNVDLTPHAEGEVNQYKISFSKWLPYSNSNEFRIPYSYVITIGEPEPEILNLYLENFGDQLDDGNTLSTSDSSDTAEESGVPDSAD
jgi:hypothetical protein